jgi:hypothetical protein
VYVKLTLENGYFQWLTVGNIPTSRIEWQRHDETSALDALLNTPLDAVGNIKDAPFTLTLGSVKRSAKVRATLPILKVEAAEISIYRNTCYRRFPSLGRMRLNLNCNA